MTARIEDGTIAGGRRALLPAVPERQARRIARAASLLLHFGVLAALALVRPEQLPEEQVIAVAFLSDMPGAAGSEGGTAGGADDRGGGREAPTPRINAEPRKTVEPEPAAPRPPDEAAERRQTPERTERPAPVVETAPAPAYVPPPPEAKPAAPPPAASAPLPPGASVRADRPGTAPRGTAGEGTAAVEGRGRGPAGEGRGVVGDASSGEGGNDYLERLRRWLAEYKHYPDAAKEQKQEGTVVVGFTVARDGTVRRAWIVESSGAPIIDGAALRMLHDASPVPPLPETYAGSEADIVMPVEYSLSFIQRYF